MYPSYKDSSISNYAIWDKELVEEYDIDYKNLTDLENLTPVFEMLKKEKNDYRYILKMTVYILSLMCMISLAVEHKSLV